jgi:hypothetical protein
VVGTVYALLTYILGFVALEVSRAGTTPQTSDEFVRRRWAAFAMLRGASPVPASSGKTVRHRLNRGGNRQATSLTRSCPISTLRRGGAARLSQQRSFLRRTWSVFPIFDRLALYVVAGSGGQPQRQRGHGE